MVPSIFFFPFLTLQKTSSRTKAQNRFSTRSQSTRPSYTCRLNVAAEVFLLTRSENQIKSNVVDVVRIVLRHRSAPEAALHLDLSEWPLTLTSLPQWLLNVPNLTSLSLARNSLSALPNEFLKLRSLRSVDLSENSLTSLPEDIVSLPLERIDISGNISLSSLPPSLSRLKLAELNVVGCNISTVSVTDFGAGKEKVMNALHRLWQEGTPRPRVVLTIFGAKQTGKTNIADSLFQIKGWMVKEGSFIHNWQRRFFYVEGQYLLYATAQGEKALDKVYLVGAKTEAKDEYKGRPNCFS